MKIEYVAPQRGIEAFNCPRCHVYAQQNWFYLRASSNSNGYGHIYENQEFLVSTCASCGAPTIWVNDTIIYPSYSTAQIASLDLPEDVRVDFEEARAIANQSPRGAAALLRLSIQKLCKHLGKPGNNINADIKALVEDGLPTRVQQALDSVRVIGNEAVHPGSIDLRDDIATVNMLFKLVNFITEKMITEPREIDELYTSLPADKLVGIDNRDRK